MLEFPIAEAFGGVAGTRLRVRYVGESLIKLMFIEPINNYKDISMSGVI